MCWHRADGGHLLCRLTSICFGTTSTEPGYFRLLVKRPPQHLALIYENSTPTLPALKSSLRTEWPPVDVGTVPLDTQEVLAILPLPLVLPFCHTCGITHGSASVSSPQVVLLFTVHPALTSSASKRKTLPLLRRLTIHSFIYSTAAPR